MSLLDFNSRRDFLDSVILTTYLTGMPDPQRSDVVPIDNAERLVIAGGCNRLKLNLVVFHDQLSEEFVSNQTTEFVSFVSVPTDPSRSVNDYRFFIFRDWLAKNPVETVFCSDAFDVHVNRDPHSMIDGDWHLWAGIHRDWRIGDGTADGKYVAYQMRLAFGDVPEEVDQQPILMAGTWGGRLCPVLRCLILLCNEIDDVHSRKPHLNCNLPVFNRVAYRDIGQGHIWMKGSPLHSVFRAYDTHADVCFVHK